MYKPLKGVKVIDFTLAGAGPSCTKILTEYGADTIWIEPLAGTSTRTVHKYDFYTTGKRNITLNLKTEKGMEVMHRLVKDADVFVSNYRPKAVKKLGLDYESLKKINPKLIYGSLTGFGEVGPEANAAGYDPVAFWAKGGMLVDIAEKGSLVVPPIAVGDISAGMALAGAIGAALYGREKTGEGCFLCSSLLALAAYLNHDAIIETQYGEEYPKSRLAPRRAFLNNYQCKDGKWITMSMSQNFDRYFNPFLKAIGREDLIGDPRWTKMEDTMYEHAPEMVAIMDEAFSKMTQDEAIAALEAIDAPVSRVQSTVEMMKDPQANANKYLYRLEATEPPAPDQKDILVPSIPVKIGSEDYGTVGNTRGPKLGEHTIEILKECGYTDTEIEDMLDQQVAGRLTD